MGVDDGRAGAGRLLTGWKQIASYFGKDESTAKRWAAQRSLPIHRVPGQKRASVYAWSAELETWLRQQGDLPAASHTPGALRDPVEFLRAWYYGKTECMGDGILQGDIA